MSSHATDKHQSGEDDEDGRYDDRPRGQIEGGEERARCVEGLGLARAEDGLPEVGVVAEVDELEAGVADEWGGHAQVDLAAVRLKTMQQKGKKDAEIYWGF